MHTDTEVPAHKAHVEMYKYMIFVNILVFAFHTNTRDKNK